MAESSGGKQIGRRSFLKGLGFGLAALGLAAAAKSALLSNTRVDEGTKKDIFTNETFKDIKIVDKTPYDIQMIPGFMYTVNGYLKQADSGKLIPEDFKCQIVFNDDLGKGEIETERADIEPVLDISKEGGLSSVNIPVKFWIKRWARPETNLSIDQSNFIRNIEGEISGNFLESVAVAAGVSSEKARKAKALYLNDFVTKKYEGSFDEKSPEVSYKTVRRIPPLVILKNIPFLNKAV